MDDLTNIHRTSVRIIEKVDVRTLKCQFVHDQAMGFPNWAKPGQKISFINKNTFLLQVMQIQIT